MRGSNTSALALAFALAGCGGASGDETSMATTSAATSESTGAASTSSGSDSSTGSSWTGAGSSEGNSTVVDESSSGESSTGGGGQVQLVNDGWVSGAPAAFQMGFVMGECWGSSYVADPEQYPFTVVGASMIVGGENMGTADFEIGLWEVDDTGMPTVSMGSGVATVSGTDDGFDAVALEPLGIVPPLVESGSFAISACLLAHDGFPGIARDDDGTITPDRNWLFADGAWSAAEGFNLTGDWIMRATIELQ